VLEVRELSAGYLGESVVRDISLSIADGEAVTLIGSNGAGKTTVFRAMCGLLPTAKGSTTFDGETITGWPAHRVTRAGLVYVPAERHLFPRMTVAENLALGAFPNKPDPARRDLVFDLFPRLVERAGQQAATMSGGEQQMLAVGRALMSKPRVLMLDEPTTGLAPKLAADAYQALAELKGQGLTLLVAEQQVPLALALADRGYVLENGVIGLSGTAADLAENPAVQRAYLGIA
jgi:branched-chain amino acid transport system ATP-binding protein